MGNYLAEIVSLAVALAFITAGRWIYFHPAGFWDKFYGDLEFLQKPYSNFVLRFGKSFGVLIFACSLFFAAGQLINLFSLATGVTHSAPVALIATVALTTVGSLYLLRAPSVQPASERAG